jgi:putative tryptophan/tyrosine transport system substrate-binding protein
VIVVIRRDLDEGRHAIKRGAFMQRRAFITLLGGAAASFPLAAPAQQAAMPVVGFLGSTSAAQWAGLVAGFREGLAQVGFVDGKNVVIEFRWAENKFDRLPALAADLVAGRAAVIVASGGTVAAQAAKAATATVPVIFVIGADPVKWGLVASLNRPGGNVTGVSFLVDALVAKRMEVLRELIPSGTSIGVLVNPKNPNAESDTDDVQTAAKSFGQEIHVVTAGGEQDLETAFASLVQTKVAGLFVIPDPFLFSRRERIVALAAQHALPAIYDRHETVLEGGLISYGPSVTDANKQAGIYAGRILSGTKPADLPVVQPTKFELAINLKTAKTLGITIPTTLLARADEVIE